MTVRLLRALAPLILVVSLAHGASAQPVPAPVDRVNQGAAYYVFTEPGAPTIEIVLVQTGARAGIYRVAAGTTLTDFLALTGSAPPRSDTVVEPTRETTQTTTIRVLRTDGTTRRSIYEATADQLLREPGRHPELISGDLVEIVTEVDVRPIRERFTLLDGLDVAARIASFASLVILLARSSN